LDTVHPRTVIIFSVDPSDASLEAFLKRLAGLVKHVREKLGGQVELARLAAATAQRETAVRLGLRWLEARGLAKVTFLPEDQVKFDPSQGAEAVRSEQILNQLGALLEETVAYRRYFKTAEKDNLM
jgi:hypothetical protein